MDQRQAESSAQVGDAFLIDSGLCRRTLPLTAHREPVNVRHRHWAPQEIYGQADDQCAAVSEAVYLTPADLSSASVAATQIVDAIGLRTDLMLTSP
jgi:hypothetical protein